MHSRLRPSPAMVVALIALFVALGGSAAALSGSNTVFTDDIANDTQPASGGNPAGGLVAADLRPGSVGSSEVAGNSLSGGDINEASLTGNVRRLNFGPTGNTPITPIATVGPYTIKGECVVISGGTSIAGIALYANGPAGTADVMFDRTDRDSSNLGAESRGLLISANTDTDFADINTSTSTTDYRRMGGTAMLRTGSVTVQVDFNAVADNRGSGDCFIYGTATRAT
jgi:hypothetical protein